MLIKLLISTHTIVDSVCFENLHMNKITFCQDIAQVQLHIIVGNAYTRHVSRNTVTLVFA